MHHRHASGCTYIITATHHAMKQLGASLANLTSITTLNTITYISRHEATAAAEKVHRIRDFLPTRRKRHARAHIPYNAKYAFKARRFLVLSEEFATSN